MITLLKDVSPEEMLGLLAQPCPSGGWWYLDSTGTIVGVDDGAPVERAMCQNTLALVLHERPEMPFIPKRERSNKRRYSISGKRYVV